MPLYRPPADVADVARGALADRRRYGRGGTHVGVRRAVGLVKRRPLEASELRVMAAWFKRHDHLASYRADRTSAASISWRLWGGAPARAWLRRVGVR